MYGLRKNKNRKVVSLTLAILFILFSMIISAGCVGGEKTKTTINKNKNNSKDS